MQTTIYQIQIEFPYSSRDNEIDDMVYFDKDVAIHEAREMQKICTEDERVILYEMIAGSKGRYIQYRKIDYNA